MPGAHGLIADLRKRGMKLALATSGHRRYVALALESAGLTGMFDIEATGESVQRGKPAPDVYLLAAEMIGTEPSRCLALEDAPIGVRSAVDAGMRCFAIPNHDTRQFAFDGASAILDSLADVLPAMVERGWLDGR